MESSFILFIGMPGGTEIMILFFAIMLLFGGKKIPELMRGFGQGIKEFNKAKEDIQESLSADDPPLLSSKKRK